MAIAARGWGQTKLCSEGPQFCGSAASAAGEIDLDGLQAEPLQLAKRFPVAIISWMCPARNTAGRAHHLNGLNNGQAIFRHCSAAVIAEKTLKRFPNRGGV